MYVIKCCTRKTSSGGAALKYHFSWLVATDIPHCVEFFLLCCETK